MRKIILLFVIALMITNASGQIISSWKSKRVDPTNNKYYKIGTISLPNNYNMFNGTFSSSFQQIGSSMETSFIKYSISARNTNGSIILKIIDNGSSGKDSYSADVIGLINGTTIDIYAGGINVSYQYPSHCLLGYAINVGGAFSETENDEGTTTLPAGTQVSMNKSLFIEDVGNIGIGTTSPSSKLEIKSNESKIIKLEREGNTKKAHIGYGTVNDGGLYFGTDDNQYSLWVQQDGNVGIGTYDPKAKLSVNGTIISTEIKVLADISQYPDFVFSDNYNLRSLKEVEKYIEDNNHLPDIPKAEEVKEGLALGEMNTKLLQKIEELTIYMIDLNKKVEKLEKENELLKSKLDIVQ